MTDQITPDPRLEATVVQLAMFQQRLDAVEHGIVRDGVAHPTWDELGPLDGQEQYLTEARRIVEAMRVLGWTPPAAGAWPKMSPVFESTEAAYAWLSEAARSRSADPLSQAASTVDDYQALDRAIGAVLFNVSNFPERAQARLLGQNMRPLTEKLVDAVKAAGFTRESALREGGQR